MRGVIDFLLYKNSLIDSLRHVCGVYNYLDIDVCKFEWTQKD